MVAFIINLHKVLWKWHYKKVIGSMRTINIIGDISIVFMFQPQKNGRLATLLTNILKTTTAQPVIKTEM
ncbi:hypothetical protein UP00_18570 [Enterobacter asburiae]|nr:hypothetical protein UP00_18570 [Enterobacter asburiae]